MADLELKQATLADAPEIAQRMKTGSTSPRLVLEFAQCAPEDVLAWNLANVRAELEGVQKLGPQMAEALKIVDVVEGKEVIAGFAIWGWGKPDEVGREKCPLPMPNLPLPAGVNMELRKGFKAKLVAMEEEHRPRERCFELLELITAVAYQRRGIGARLVRYGLDRADQEGVKCFLSASPMGAPLYKKLGFEEVGRAEVGLGKYGGVEGTKHVHLAMIRQPQKIEG